MEDDHRDASAHPASAELMTSTRQPAVLLDRHLDVVSSNALARALSPSFVEGVNIARFTFLATAEMQDLACWRGAAGQVTAMLRDSLDEHEGDREFLTIVGELSAKSRDFSDAWAGNGSAVDDGVVTFFDTRVGDLPLGYRRTRLPDDGEHTLLLFEPSDDMSRELLERLSLTLQ